MLGRLILLLLLASELLLRLALEPALLFAASLLGLYLRDDLVNGLTLRVRREALDVTSARVLDQGLVLLARLGLRRVLRERKHLHVVLQDLVRQALQNPLVMQRFQGRHSLHRRPREALEQEVDKVLRLRVTQPLRARLVHREIARILALEDLRECFCARLPRLSSRVRDQHGLILVVEE